MNKHVGDVGPIKDCLQPADTEQCGDDFEHDGVERLGRERRLALVHALALNEGELVTGYRAGVVALILRAFWCTFPLVLRNPFLQTVANGEPKIGDQLAVH
jgi:hypothetical protein